jgi:hypothetical protein
MGLGSEKSSESERPVLEKRPSQPILISNSNFSIQFTNDMRKIGDENEVIEYKEKASPPQSSPPQASPPKFALEKFQAELQLHLNAHIDAVYYLNKIIN